MNINFGFTSKTADMAQRRWQLASHFGFSSVNQIDIVWIRGTSREDAQKYHSQRNIQPSK
jgi:hypothetical protein